MKLLLLFFGVLVCASFLTAQLQQQPEREALLRLNKAEIENLYNIIDESATPGSVRKPLLQKIEVAYKAAFTQQQPIPAKQDTTKSKKP